MPGAYIAPGVQLEGEVYVGPNATILGPDSPGEASTVIGRGVRIGANATLLAGVTIGARAEIAPGSVVKRSVPPLALVEGNPAHIVGYVETPELQAQRGQRLGQEPGVLKSQVRGVTLHTFRQVADLRGNLTVGDFSREVPFVPKRYFMVFEVPTAETRGEHAHLRCEQFLVAVKGSVSVVADDGNVREEFLLDRPNLGLYLPPMVWGIQYRYSSDAVLLVFASELYDPEDYVRDYGRFIELVEADAARP